MNYFTNVSKQSCPLEFGPIGKSPIRAFDRGRSTVFHDFPSWSCNFLFDYLSSQGHNPKTHTQTQYQTFSHQNSKVKAKKKKEQKKPLHGPYSQRVMSHD